jgi:hypothetical protein
MSLTIAKTRPYRPSLQAAPPDPPDPPKESPRQERTQERTQERPRQPETVKPIERDKPTAKDYRRLLVDARRKQLKLTSDAAKRMERNFDASAKRIRGLIEALPDEASARRDTLRSLLSDIDAVLSALRSDQNNLLGAGLLELSQQAADTQVATADLVGAASEPRLAPSITRAVKLTDGAEIEVRFGRLAVGAVERISQRVYSDGLTLSQRLHHIDEATRAAVGDTVVQGITEQVSARELGKRVQSALSTPGKETPRYQAMRIARTEINNVHREATVMAALDGQTGQLKSYIEGFRWNLSLGHKNADICDGWAGHGIYRPDEVPVDHPHGLCYLTTELVDLPGIGGPGKKPDTDRIPETELRYYAEKQQDPVAQRLLDRRRVA